MTHVIYEIESTRFVRIIRNGYWQDAEYKTKGAATAALNKMITDPHHSAWKQTDMEFGLVTLAIAEKNEFHSKIEKTKKVRNLLNPKGGEIEIPVNTPLCCDPSSETYHSM